MAATINDKISLVSDGSTRPSSATVQSTRAIGASTLSCDDLTGWATDTAVHFVSYKVDSEGRVVAGSQIDMKGIVTGNNINNIVVTSGAGTDQGNSVGDIVIAVPTAKYARELAEHLLVSHNQDGSLKNGIITTSKIAEGAVGTSNLSNGAVTPDKRSGGIARGFITGTQMGVAGNIVVTGVGFKPREVQFFAGADATMSAASSSARAYGVYGFMIDDGNGGVYSFNTSFTASPTFTARHHSSSAYVRLSSTSTNIAQRLNGVSLDEDGFTVECDATDSSNGVWWVARA